LDIHDTTIIHVGFHKSASTYLQNIFLNIDIKYIYLDRDLLDCIEHDDFNQRNFFRGLEKYSFPGKDNIHTTILSNEALSGHPHGYDSIDPYRTAHRLKQSFPEASILIIVRNQIDYMLSLYAFRVAVKGEEYRSISRFLKEDGEKGLFLKLEYDRLVQHYMQLFGHDRVLVLPMEMLKMDPLLFHSRLGKLIQYDIGSFSGGSGKVNASTKLEALIALWRSTNFFFSWLWRPCRLILPGNREMRLRYRYYFFKQRCSATLSPYFKNGRQLSVPDWVVEQCRERYSASNERLGVLTGINLNNYGYL